MTAIGLSYDTLYSVAGNLAILGWLGLVLLPRSDLIVKVIARLVIPGIIGLLHLTLFLTHQSDVPDGGGLGSISELQIYFSVDGLMLVAWVHLLAWDLFVGSWEIEDSQKQGIHHLFVVPCLAATFMLGPSGFLVYLLLREGVRRFRPRPAAEA